MEWGAFVTLIQRAPPPRSMSAPGWPWDLFDPSTPRGRCPSVGCPHPPPRPSSPAEASALLSALTAPPSRPAATRGTRLTRARAWDSLRGSTAKQMHVTFTYDRGWVKDTGMCPRHSEQNQSQRVHTRFISAMNTCVAGFGNASGQLGLPYHGPPEPALTPWRFPPELRPGQGPPASLGLLTAVLPTVYPAGPLFPLPHGVPAGHRDLGEERAQGRCRNQQRIRPPHVGQGEPGVGAPRLQTMAGLLRAFFLGRAHPDTLNPPAIPLQPLLLTRTPLASLNWLGFRPPLNSCFHGHLPAQCLPDSISEQ